MIVLRNDRVASPMFLHVTQFEPSYIPHIVVDIDFRNDQIIFDGSNHVYARHLVLDLLLAIAVILKHIA